MGMRQDGEALPGGMLIWTAVVEQHEWANRASLRRQQSINFESAAELDMPRRQNELEIAHAKGA